MQRLDSQPDAALARVIDDRRDTIHDHLPRAVDIASGAGPFTSTSRSVPSAAASSIARRLSSIFFRRSSAVAAGNMPPRHRLDTRKPCIANQPPCCHRIITDRVTPRPNPLDAMLYTRIHDLAQRSLASRHLVEAQPRSSATMPPLPRAQAPAASGAQQAQGQPAAAR